MTFKLTRREPCMYCGTHSQAAKLERERIVALLNQLADDVAVDARDPRYVSLVDVARETLRCAAAEVARGER